MSNVTGQEDSLTSLRHSRYCQVVTVNVLTQTMPVQSVVQALHAAQTVTVAELQLLLTTIEQLGPKDDSMLCMLDGHFRYGKLLKNILNTHNTATSWRYVKHLQCACCRCTRPDAIGKMRLATTLARIHIA